MDIKNALDQTAKKNNVSADTVISEIENTIDELYNSSDPIIREKWYSICKDGSKPTVEQLLEYMKNEVVDKTDEDAGKLFS
ncbi:hypothetical protein [Ruminococcus sp.]|uniref:hypothetical protein n=1 Tax=Ruminococcus sp. TaxID=41978 RepID=UPI001B0318F6|nr:hypothetical protein [Ruminococcus sp.]MBO5559099.1 hypothetical protein [Ruminococcus sp.]